VREEPLVEMDVAVTTKSAPVGLERVPDGRMMSPTTARWR